MANNPNWIYGAAESGKLINEAVARHLGQYQEQNYALLMWKLQTAARRADYAKQQLDQKVSETDKIKAQAQYNLMLEGIKFQHEKELKAMEQPEEKLTEEWRGGKKYQIKKISGREVSAELIPEKTENQPKITTTIDNERMGNKEVYVNGELLYSYPLSKKAGISEDEKRQYDIETRDINKELDDLIQSQSEIGAAYQMSLQNNYQARDKEGKKYTSSQIYAILEDLSKKIEELQKKKQQIYDKYARD